MARLTKAQAEAARRYDKLELHSPTDALELVKALAHAKFVEGVDSVFQLGIDARKADQMVRGTVALPHGTGKEVRILAFAEGDDAKAAEAAGADIVGGKELAEELAGGRSLDFDLALATPPMMPHVGKLGPILGPRGLMPNPKSGTVAADIGTAVGEFKAGRVEYRNDRYGNVHVPIGRVSFDVSQLSENLGAVAEELIRNRPASAKGRFIRRAAVSSTMGPGVRIDPSQIDDLVRSLR